MKDKVDISIKDIDKLFGQIRVGVYSNKVSVLCKLNNYGFKKLVDEYNSIHSNKISLDDFTKGNYDMIIHYDFLNNYGPYYLQIDKTDNEKMWNILKNYQFDINIDDKLKNAFNDYVIKDMYEHQTDCCGTFVEYDISTFDNFIDSLKAENEILMDIVEDYYR